MLVSECPSFMYERSILLKHATIMVTDLGILLIYYRHFSITFMMISNIIFMREVWSELKSSSFILVQVLFVMNRGIWAKTGPNPFRVKFEKFWMLTY